MQQRGGDSRTVVVASFGYRHEAEMAQGFLESAGIRSLLIAQDAAGAEVGLSFVNRARLAVLVDDLEAARDVLEDSGFEASLEPGKGAS